MLTGTMVLKVLMVILSCWHVDRHQGNDTWRRRLEREDVSLVDMKLIEEIFSGDNCRYYKIEVLARALVLNLIRL
jgi:hypothetical protein